VRDTFQGLRLPLRLPFFSVYVIVQVKMKGLAWAACLEQGALDAMRKHLPVLIWIGLLCWPLPAWATQQHGDPEGLYAHQMAHVFFIFSMGLLIYWLRKRRLVVEKGWRYIQFAAVFFIAWNMDAFLIHWLDEQTELIRTMRIGLFEIHLATPDGFVWLGPVYYVAKLDHLLCVPALLFLLMGLRRLLKDQLEAQGAGESAP
jgi:hypothetical protein